LKEQIWERGTVLSAGVAQTVPISSSVTTVKGFRW
jgi:hypothetical protein